MEFPDLEKLDKQIVEECTNFRGIDAVRQWRPNSKQFDAFLKCVGKHVIEENDRIVYDALLERLKELKDEKHELLHDGPLQELIHVKRAQAIGEEVFTRITGITKIRDKAEHKPEWKWEYRTEYPPENEYTPITIRQLK